MGRIHVTTKWPPPELLLRSDYKPGFLLCGHLLFLFFFFPFGLLVYDVIPLPLAPDRLLLLFFFLLRWCSCYDNGDNRCEGIDTIPPEQQSDI